MASVTSIISSLPPNSPYYTFEVFPPKTEIGTANLVDRIERMSLLSPSWIHVTWGAGGSTQERSLDLIGEVIRMGREAGKGAAGACLHLTCTNMERTKLEEALEVRNNFEMDRFEQDD